MREIFLIDDDPMYVKLMTNHLKTLGFEVSSFGNVEKALPELKRKPYIIILDHFFDSSQVSGLDYIKIIKREARKSSLIYMTSVTDTDVIAKCLELGADAYIPKSESVLVRLRTVLDQIEEKSSKRSLFSFLKF